MQNLQGKSTQLQMFDRTNLKVNEITQTAIIAAYNNTVGTGINPVRIPELIATIHILLREYNITRHSNYEDSTAYSDLLELLKEIKKPFIQ